MVDGGDGDDIKSTQCATPLPFFFIKYNHIESPVLENFREYLYS